MLTNFFIALISLAWIRLFVISLAVLFDHARLRGRHDLLDRQTSLEDVTIVIPAYEEAAFLPETLESLRELIQLGAGLVVVDDGSLDQTARIAGDFIASLGRGRLLRHGRNLGKAAALNTGVADAETPFVLTLDADTTVTSHGVGLAARVLRDDDSEARRIAVVAFDVSAKPADKLLCELQGIEYDCSLNFERRGQWVFSAVSVAPGAASLWRVADLAEIGGFSAETSTEDVDVTLRLAARGRRAAHCVGASAFTSTPTSFSKLIAQRRRWCLGHYQCIPRHARNLGGDAIFTGLTYPNFLFLAAFLPAMLVLSLATLFVESGFWISMLGLLTVVWLAFVYIQRWLALTLSGRSARPLVFLIEPFSTAALHICATGLLAFGSIGRLFGARSDVWATRSK
jgi:cellulose synthase/poly-beta-1,6-N-acetylglucosamine synthase-like glycosyltransferase